MGWWKILRQVTTNWGVHRCSAQSAALAFYTIFSLAPILVVVITLAGVIWGEEAVRGQAYGAAGSLVVILLWVYYSALIFFFGAELSRVHSRQFRTRARPEEGAVRVPEGQGGAVAQR